jgi:hypothetical protein
VEKILLYESVQDEHGFSELKFWELSSFSACRPQERLYWNLDRQQSLLDFIPFCIIFCIPLKISYSRYFKGCWIPCIVITFANVCIVSIVLIYRKRNVLGAESVTAFKWGVEM